MRFTLHPQMLTKAADKLEQYRMTPDRFLSEPCMKLCREQPYLISYPELIHLMDQLRLEKQIDAMQLAHTLAMRHAPILSDMLYQYWQQYPTDAKVSNVCRLFLQGADELSEVEVLWKKWLGVTNPLLGCAKTICEKEKELCCTWIAACASVGIKSDKSLFSYIKYLQWCFREISCSDAELLQACKCMRPSERKILQSNMFQQAPLLEKDGTRLDHTFYTEQYPQTSMWLTNMVNDNSADEVLHLLRNYMIAAQISDEMHRHFWEDYFLQTRRNWKELHYQHHLDKGMIEISGTKQRRVLDFYQEHIIFVVQEDFIAVDFNVDALMEASKSASPGKLLVIQDKNWRSRLEKIQI